MSRKFPKNGRVVHSADTFSFHEANLNMASQNITLYHYTSSDGQMAIRSTEMIRSSTGGRHARFGNGVYFTDMSPQDFTMTEVSINNYRYPNAKRKLEYCIIVTMPRDKVLQCSPENRRVFLHKGDVNLMRRRVYTYEIEKCQFLEPQSNTAALHRRHLAQGGAAAASNLTSDIDVRASSCDLHFWLSSF